MEVVPQTIWGIPIPFTNGTVVVYVVRGDRTALIDSGVAKITVPLIGDGLSALGIALDEIDVLINTHGHPDHAGGNADLRAAVASVTVMAHEADAWLMRGPTEHLRHDCDPATALAEMGEWAALSERRRFLEEAVGVDSGPDTLLTDGDAIDLGNLILRVLHTPGHTAGSICVLAPEMRVLFAGDAVQRHGGGRIAPPLYSDSWAYRASLVRLRELGPLTACLSHAYIGADGFGEPVLMEKAIAHGLEESITEVDRLGDAVKRALAVERRADRETSLRPLTARVCSDLQLAPSQHEGFARVATTVRAHWHRSRPTR